MKIGDLVRRVPQGTGPLEVSDCAELGAGVVIGIEDDHFYRGRRPRQLFVMWPQRGLSWEYLSGLEVINANR